MKKKPANKTAASKRPTAKRVKRVSSFSLIPVEIRSDRFIIFTSCIVLFIFTFIFMDRRSISQSVAGISIVQGLYDQATVGLPSVPGAVSYNIYYRQSSTSSFDQAVRNIPARLPAYTISYLKKGTSYQYRISALNAQGSEFWFSPTQNLVNLQPM